ncbi:MAG: hypothetical protein D3915_02640 [Candidatus Electrothrix sp. AU1_5]|nr:hypothetical protein [Candidatus Electrothrix gigas]
MKAHAQLPEGIKFYTSSEEIAQEPGLSAYSHLLGKAWRDFKLTGVICVSGIPTLYLCCFSEPLDSAKATDYHRRFWNQGVATILVLADPKNVRLYSGLAIPENPQQRKSVAKSLIETIPLADYALRIQNFYFQLATGNYYQQNSDKFDTKQSVDTYLLDNLGALRDEISAGPCGLKKSEAHTFLARVLFSSYLIDRSIIDLSNFPYCACQPGSKLVDVLEPLKATDAKKILYRLFADLKEKFNGSMFEQSSTTEQEQIQDDHIDLLVKFLRGHKVRSRQLSLGFWAYDFQWIPVETISAIYEDFLAKEDRKGKQKTGAFYTPRFLAETVLDVAVQNDSSWATKSFLDPACGSGIFLVALFNRLVSLWLIEHPTCTYEEKAAALLNIMRRQLCGFDINPTACRIACFSLYLAFLDRFDPPDIIGYLKRTGKKLPRIIQIDDEITPEPDFPVIFQKDFLCSSQSSRGRFDYVVGNPPWQGRGKKQIAHDFALQIPEYLVPQGRACILLPSKVLLNSTSNPFQSQWLQSITLEKIVQLADYRFILFKNAICPSIIARFIATPPDQATHLVEYETPKVRRIDLRKGIIPIAPCDRKRILLRELLHGAREKKAPVIWKQHLWGTPRDSKFLQLLLGMPTLGEITGPPNKGKRWMKGQGFQPVTKKESLPPKRPWWKPSRLFLTAKNNIPGLILLTNDCRPIEDTFNSLRRSPNQELFSPPLVIISQGISKGALPKVVFCDFPVLFQDSLQSIAGPKEDEDLLLFLACYLRSKLARYFLFHTAANWGTERDKVHLDELLRLPFPLPGSEDAVEDAEEIVKTIAGKARRLKKKIEQGCTFNPRENFLFSGDTPELLAARRQEAVNALQAEVEPLIYQYFDLIDQEIILIEDTVEVFIKSATPPGLASRIPTLELIHKNDLPVYRDGLEAYATTLVNTLNSWALQAGSEVRVSPSGGVDVEKGLACVTLQQTDEPFSFKTEELSGGLSEALVQLQNTVKQSAGHLDYLRGIFWFDNTRIHFIKPYTIEYWTRTAALNDAAETYASIAKARQATRRSSFGR